MVIRDWRGVVIGALSMRISLPQTVAKVEILACRRQVIFALELSLLKVVFESDVAGVINAIKYGSAEHSSFGHIIDDIYHSSSQLNCCIFVLLIVLVIRLLMLWQRKQNRGKILRSG